MRVQVAVPDELGPAEWATWEAIQRDQPGLGSPFLAPPFVRAVGRSRADARVAVVDGVSGPAGFLPFQLGEEGGGVPIGYGVCDAQAFVGPSDLVRDARELVTLSGLTSWSFDHLRTHQAGFEPFHRALHRSPVIDLSGGHEDFLAAVGKASKDVLAQVARRRRKLEREVGPVVTAWHEPEGDAFAALAEWKSAQYGATGVWDRFAQPWLREVLEGLRTVDEPGCTGVLSTTRAGDRLVAVHLGLAGPDGLSWWFPAYDAALGAYSPGLIQLLDLASLAAERGLSLIDLGRGEHGYKLRVATGSYLVAEGTVPAR